MFIIILKYCLKFWDSLVLVSMGGWLNGELTGYFENLLKFGLLLE